MPADSICVSAKPLSQRVGSGTFSSTISPAPVDTRKASLPTFRCRGSDARSPASAWRSGGFTSTLVTPGATCVASSAAASTSRRAYTPQHTLNDSKRRPSGVDVTTGSAARSTAARVLGGT